MHLNPRSTLLVCVLSAIPGADRMWADDQERVALEPFVTSQSDAPTAFRWLLPSDPGYLEWKLARLGLKPLAGESFAPGEERFRLLWLRSFHPAALFEVRFAADGTGVNEAKVWEQSSDGWRWVTRRSVALGAGDRVGHRRDLGRLGFFDLPFADGRQGLDGASWLFEVRDGERSHAVHRWSPETGSLRTFGEDLIEAAISSEFLPIY